MSGWNQNVDPGVPLGTIEWGRSASVVSVPTMVTQPEPVMEEPLFIPYAGGAQYRALPAISGIQNVANPMGDIPYVAGTYKMRPPLAAQFVNVVQNGVTYAMGLFCLGYGPLDVSEVKLGDKLLSTIPGCKYEILTGADPNNEKVTIFNPDFKDLNVNSVLKYNVQAKRTASQSAIELQVDIRFPNGLTQFDTNGNRSSATVVIKVEYSTDGVSWTNVPPENGLSSDPALTETNNTTAAYTKSITWLVTKGTYQVRVTRQTADSTDSKLINDTVWTTLRSFNDTPSYSLFKDKNGNKISMGFIAVRIKASDTQNGQLSDLNCIVKRKQNYYNGSAWTTSPVITSNPAWIFADILTGSANIRARDKTDLDATQLKAWADFCDANGYEFNYIWDSGITVPEALKQVAAAGRASVTHNDGKYAVVIDQKKTVAVQHFSPRNSRSVQCQGNFPEPPQAFDVQFVDKADGYNSSVRTVYWDGYNSDGSNGLTEATDKEPWTLIGVTDKDQAWKLARYTMAIGYLRRRIVSFVTDIQNLICQRFDMIRVGSDTLGFGQGQGIITAVTTDGSGNVTSLTIDEYVTMVTGKSYGIWVRMADMSEAHYALTNAGTTTNVLTLSTPIPAVTSPKPTVECMVLFGEYGSEAAEMLVVGVENLDNKEARIRCIDHAPGVFDAITGAIPAFESGVTSVPVQQELVPTPVISAYETDETVMLRDTDGSLQTRIQLTMEPPPANIQYWEVRTRLNGATVWGAPQIFPVAAGEIYLGPVNENSFYDVQVHAITFSSKRSLTPAELTGIYVIGKQTPPPTPPAILVNGDNLEIPYNATVLGQDVPKDFAGIRLKWFIGSSGNWDLGSVACDLLLGSTFPLNHFPKGLITIMAKAVDTAGNESTDFARLVRHFGDEVISNQIYSYDHSSENYTKGTITNGTVVSNTLRTINDSGLMYGADDEAKFYGPDDTALFYQVNQLPLTYQWKSVLDPQYFPAGTHAPDLVLDYFQQSESFLLEYRNGGDSLFYDPAGDSYPFYGPDDSDLFYDADPPFSPWPGRLTVTGAPDTIEFRASLTASRFTLGILGPIIEILDAPDVTEVLDDVSISASGTNLALTETYRTIKSVRAQWQQQPGDLGPYYPAVINKSTSGPLVKVFDAAGASVAATIDATIVGY